MLFNSYVFIFCFLPAILMYWWCRGISIRNRLLGLVAASYLFYGWWDYRFVLLLLLSTIVDFHAGKRLATSNPHRKYWLLLSTCSNLGLLAFFKYSGFFAESMNGIANWLRIGGPLPVWEIVLPVGISFYTFQTMSYSIDIFRGEAKPANSFWHFAAYVSLFPQLIAGPIVRYRDLDEQLRNIRSEINWNLFALGLFFFVCGMVQKVLLADTIAGCINPLFIDYPELQFFGSWFAMLGYTCQLYFDFTGYSNMAVGLGLLLGFQMPQNFNSPYKSANIAEFWRRWHMTLSFWLRDYLFIPLGGNRCGPLITMRNLFLVMFLGGLWHGAGWTFVIWGLFHGLLLAIYHISRHRWNFEFPRLLAVTMTFFCVVLGWVVFRATDLEMATHLFGAMFGWMGFEREILAGCGGVKSIATLGVLLAVVFLSPNVWQIRFRANGLMACATATLFVICVLRFDAESPFLYFQF